MQNLGVTYEAEKKGEKFGQTFGSAEPVGQGESRRTLLVRGEPLEPGEGGALAAAGGDGNLQWLVAQVSAVSDVQRLVPLIVFDVWRLVPLDVFDAS